MDNEIPDYTDLKESMKKLLDKFLGRENIDNNISNDINISELEIICQEIFKDDNFTNKIINLDVVIDLEILEGLGQDKDNSIFSYLDRTYTKTGKYLFQKVSISVPH